MNGGPRLVAGKGALRAVVTRRVTMLRVLFVLPVIHCFHGPLLESFLFAVTLVAGMTEDCDLRSVRDRRKGRRTRRSEIVPNVGSAQRCQSCFAGPGVI